jgi:hypothetical protein
MKRRLFRYLVAAAFLMAAGLVLTPWAEAQDQAASGAPRNETSSVPTPRTPGGKPDLSGFWGGGGGGDGEGGGGARPDAQGNLVQLVRARGCHPGMAVCHAAVNQSNDSTFTGRMSKYKPVYKPQYWDKVQYLDHNTNSEDPLFTCQPYGVPRMGPPTKIVQTATEAIFLYAQGGASSANQDFRIIPIDGRKHDPIRAQDTTYYGEAVGTWEGDTLAVESVGFNDITWIERGGYFHSNNMRVIERFRREGNTLHYQATVIDPDVLLEPYVMAPRVLRLNTNPKATIVEGLPCEERDKENMVGKIHH